MCGCDIYFREYINENGKLAYLTMHEKLWKTRKVKLNVMRINITSAIFSIWNDSK